MLKGIDPLLEAATTSLNTKIVQHDSQKSFVELVTGNHILIGKTMAEQLDITPGSCVTLLYAPQEQTNTHKIRLEHTTAYVSGTFNTGIDELDAGVVFCSFDLLHTLWPESGIEQINVRLKDGFNESECAHALRSRLHLEAYSWKELYPALVTALTLEKYAMFFILGLVMLIASMNIISLAFMHITQKRCDIAILQAMGMSVQKIRLTFLLVSAGTGFIGSLIGLVLALGIGWLLKVYPFIHLPDAYYTTSHLPVDLSWYLFASVACTVTLLNIIAAWVPTHKIQHQIVSTILRFEG
jgi:ABC-type lipoprotein release transport system permease subunit